VKNAASRAGHYSLPAKMVYKNAASRAGHYSLPAKMVYVYRNQLAGKPPGVTATTASAAHRPGSREVTSDF
jgi:hypothetical protein